MANTYWNEMYSGWAWILWFGMIFLFFSGIGNWGYTYQAHRKQRDLFEGKDAFDILTERYAKGEIQGEEFAVMRDQIMSTLNCRANEKQIKEQRLANQTTPGASALAT